MQGGRLREGEIEKRRRGRRRRRRRGRTAEEKTQSRHTKTGTRKLCYTALGSPFFFFLLFGFFFFFFYLQLEVNRSVTDSRELLRWFVRGQEGPSSLKAHPSTEYSGSDETFPLMQ